MPVWTSQHILDAPLRLLPILIRTVYNILEANYERAVPSPFSTGPSNIYKKRVPLDPLDPFAAESIHEIDVPRITPRMDRSATAAQGPESGNSGPIRGRSFAALLQSLTDSRGRGLRSLFDGGEFDAATILGGGAAGGEELMHGLGPVRGHIDEAHVLQLLDMGFHRFWAERALSRFRNDVNQAVDFLLRDPIYQTAPPNNATNAPAASATGESAGSSASAPALTAEASASVPAPTAPQASEDASAAAPAASETALTREGREACESYRQWWAQNSGDYQQKLDRAWNVLYEATPSTVGELVGAKVPVVFDLTLMLGLLLATPELEGVTFPIIDALIKELDVCRVPGSHTTFASRLLTLLMYDSRNQRSSRLVAARLSETIPSLTQLLEHGTTLQSDWASSVILLISAHHLRASAIVVPSTESSEKDKDPMREFLQSTANVMPTPAHLRHERMGPFVSPSCGITRQKTATQKHFVGVELLPPSNSRYIPRLPHRGADGHYALPGISDDASSGRSAAAAPTAPVANSPASAPPQPPAPPQQQEQLPPVPPQVEVARWPEVLVNTMLKISVSLLQKVTESISSRLTSAGATPPPPSVDHCHLANSLLRLLLDLTRAPSSIPAFVEAKGVQVVVASCQESLFSGHYTIATIILRNVVEGDLFEHVVVTSLQQLFGRRNPLHYQPMGVPAPSQQISFSEFVNGMETFVLRDAEAVRKVCLKYCKTSKSNTPSAPFGSSPARVIEYIPPVATTPAETAKSHGGSSSKPAVTVAAPEAPFVPTTSFRTEVVRELLSQFCFMFQSKETVSIDVTLTVPNVAGLSPAVGDASATGPPAPAASSSSSVPPSAPSVRTLKKSDQAYHPHLHFFRSFLLQLMQELMQSYHAHLREEFTTLASSLRCLGTQTALEVLVSASRAVVDEQNSRYTSAVQTVAESRRASDVLLSLCCGPSRTEPTFPGVPIPSRRPNMTATAPNEGEVPASLLQSWKVLLRTIHDAVAGVVSNTVGKTNSIQLVAQLESLVKLVATIINDPTNQRIGKKGPVVHELAQEFINVGFIPLLTEIIGRLDLAIPAAQNLVDNTLAIIEILGKTANNIAAHAKRSKSDKSKKSKEAKSAKSAVTASATKGASSSSSAPTNSSEAAQSASASLSNEEPSAAPSKASSAAPSASVDATVADASAAPSSSANPATTTGTVSPARTPRRRRSIARLSALGGAASSDPTTSDQAGHVSGGTATPAKATTDGEDEEESDEEEDEDESEEDDESDDDDESGGEGAPVFDQDAHEEHLAQIASDDDVDLEEDDDEDEDDNVDMIIDGDVPSDGEDGDDDDMDVLAIVPDDVEIVEDDDDDDDDLEDGDDDDDDDDDGHDDDDEDADEDGDGEDEGGDEDDEDGEDVEADVEDEDNGDEDDGTLAELAAAAAASRSSTPAQADAAANNATVPVATPAGSISTSSGGRLQQRQQNRRTASYRGTRLRRQGSSGQNSVDEEDDEDDEEDEDELDDEAADAHDQGAFHEIMNLVLAEDANAGAGEDEDEDDEEDPGSDFAGAGHHHHHHQFHFHGGEDEVDGDADSSDDDDDDDDEDDGDSDAEMFYPPGYGGAGAHHHHPFQRTPYGLDMMFPGGGRHGYPAQMRGAARPGGNQWTLIDDAAAAAGLPLNMPLVPLGHAGPAGGWQPLAPWQPIHGAGAANNGPAGELGRYLLTHGGIAIAPGVVAPTGGDAANVAAAAAASSRGRSSNTASMVWSPFVPHTSSTMLSTSLFPADLSLFLHEALEGMTRGSPAPRYLTPMTVQLSRLADQIPHADRPTELSFIRSEVLDMVGQLMANSPFASSLRQILATDAVAADRTIRQIILILLMVKRLRGLIRDTLSSEAYTASSSLLSMHPFLVRPPWSLYDYMDGTAVNDTYHAQRVTSFSERTMHFSTFHDPAHGLPSHPLANEVYVACELLEQSLRDGAEITQRVLQQTQQICALPAAYYRIHTTNVRQRQTLSLLRQSSCDVNGFGVQIWDQLGGNAPVAATNAPNGSQPPSGPHRYGVPYLPSSSRSSRPAQISGDFFSQLLNNARNVTVTGTADQPSFTFDFTGVEMPAQAVNELFGAASPGNAPSSPPTFDRTPPSNNTLSPPPIADVIPPAAAAAAPSALPATAPSAAPTAAAAPVTLANLTRETMPQPTDPAFQLLAAEAGIDASYLAELPDTLRWEVFRDNRPQPQRLSVPAPPTTGAGAAAGAAAAASSRTRDRRSSLSPAFAFNWGDVSLPSAGSAADAAVPAAAAAATTATAAGAPSAVAADLPSEVMDALQGPVRDDLQNILSTADIREANNNSFQDLLADASFNPFLRYPQEPSTRERPRLFRRTAATFGVDIGTDPLTTSDGSALSKLPKQKKKKGPKDGPEQVKLPNILALLRLLYLAQPIKRNLARSLAQLCTNSTTRATTMALLLAIILGKENVRLGGGPTGQALVGFQPGLAQGSTPTQAQANEAMDATIGNADDQNDDSDMDEPATAAGAAASAAPSTAPTGDASSSLSSSSAVSPMVVRRSLDIFFYLLSAGGHSSVKVMEEMWRPLDLGKLLPPVPLGKLGATPAKGKGKEKMVDSSSAATSVIPFYTLVHLLSQPSMSSDSSLVVVLLDTISYLMEPSVTSLIADKDVLTNLPNDVRTRLVGVLQLRSCSFKTLQHTVTALQHLAVIEKTNVNILNDLSASAHDIKAPMLKDLILLRGILQPFSASSNDATILPMLDDAHDDANSTTTSKAALRSSMRSLAVPKLGSRHSTQVRLARILRAIAAMHTADVSNPISAAAAAEPSSSSSASGASATSLEMPSIRSNPGHYRRGTQAFMHERSILGLEEGIDLTDGPARVAAAAGVNAAANGGNFPVNPDGTAPAGRFTRTGPEGSKVSKHSVHTFKAFAQLDLNEVWEVMGDCLDVVQQHSELSHISSLLLPALEAYFVLAKNLKQVLASAHKAAPEILQEFIRPSALNSVMPSVVSSPTLRGASSSSLLDLTAAANTIGTTPSRVGRTSSSLLRSGTLFNSATDGSDDNQVTPLTPAELEIIRPYLAACLEKFERFEQFADRYKRILNDLIR